MDYDWEGEGGRLLGTTSDWQIKMLANDVSSFHSYLSETWYRCLVSFIPASCFARTYSAVGGQILPKSGSRLSVGEGGVSHWKLDAVDLWGNPCGLWRALRIIGVTSTEKGNSCVLRKEYLISVILS